MDFLFLSYSDTRRSWRLNAFCQRQLTRDHEAGNIFWLTKIPGDRGTRNCFVASQMPANQMIQASNNFEARHLHEAYEGSYGLEIMNNRDIKEVLRNCLRRESKIKFDLLQENTSIWHVEKYFGRCLLGCLFSLFLRHKISFIFYCNPYLYQVLRRMRNISKRLTFLKNDWFFVVKDVNSFATDDKFGA